MKNIPIILLLMMAACQKNLDSRLISVSDAVRDSSGNVRNVLRHSSFHLFNQAFARAGLDSSFGFYTVFAPTDSAMTAAGLTSAAINSLTRDSLDKIIGYHIVRGIYGDSALEDSLSSVQGSTLRQDAYFSPQYGTLYHRQNLYIRRKGVLYLNGLQVNQGETALSASNGWIHPVHRVLTAPTQDLWSIIRSRPELSMYAAAVQMTDSIGSQSLFNLQTWDSSFFATVVYSGSHYSTLITPVLSTVFAPTNTAFAKAGFNTPNDILQYIQNSPFPGYAGNSPTNPNLSLYNYESMDSVLKLHYLYTPYQNGLFYPDLLFSKDSVINQGELYSESVYATQYNTQYLLQPFHLRFPDQQGTLYIRWSANPSIPTVPVPLDPARNFLGTNGVIYEIDQLFYPHN